MGEQRDNSIGDINKRRIYNYITDHPDGVYQHELIDKTKLSRQTVYTLLKKLLNEDKIFNRNKQYFVEDSVLNSILLFGMIMEDAIGDIGQLVSRSSASSKYCKQKFANQNHIEKSIFEFANDIGAFIVYILIEAMRPSDNNTIPKDKKKSLVPRLIDRSIRSHKMYEAFSEYFKDFISDKQNAEQIHDYCYIMECFELKEEYYKKVIAAFKNIYPIIYDTLEKRWSDYIKLSLCFRTPRCNHKWEEIQVYRFGKSKYVGCCRCGSVMDSASLKL